MRKRIRSVGWLAWGAMIACGGDAGVESSAAGVLARGLVSAVECDGDEPSLTIDAPSAGEPLAVALDPAASVAGEPLGPGCEGLGRALGRDVEIAARIADDGTLVANRVDPAS